MRPKYLTTSIYECYHMNEFLILPLWQHYTNICIFLKKADESWVSLNSHGTKDKTYYPNPDSEVEAVYYKKITILVIVRYSLYYIMT